jgi:pimeloyl-ACP methyl ester carboxylesterase
MVSGTSLSKVQLSDTELHYTQNGVGDPVILVHGGFGDYRQWGHLQKVLSDRFRVISYSRRGAYPNNRSLGRKSGIPEHSADLSSLITLISKTPVHLVGESYGAFVAARCAIDHPEKVNTLSIDEPPMFPLLRNNEGDKAELLQFEKEVLKPATACFETGRFEDGVRVIIGFLEGSEDAFDSLPAEVRDILAANSKAFRDELEAGFDSISFQDVSRLKTPTLLLKSETGPRLLKRIVDILHKAIPNAIFKEIRGTSHGTIIDSHEYSSSVRKFILAQSRNSLEA